MSTSVSSPPSRWRCVMAPPPRHPPHLLPDLPARSVGPVLQPCLGKNKPASRIPITAMILLGRDLQCLNQPNVQKSLVPWVVCEARNERYFCPLSFPSQNSGFLLPESTLALLMHDSKRGQDFQRWNSKWALWIPPRDSIPPNAGSRPPCGKWVFCILSVVRRDRRKLAFFEDLPCECRHWAEYFTCLITLNPQRSHEMATIIPIS